MRWSGVSGRLRQPGPVDLAAGGARQGRHFGDDGRDQRRWQVVAHVRREVVDRPVRGGDHVGRQPRGTGLVDDGPHRRVDHAGVGEHGGLHLARLDADAVDLHLRVGPPDEFEAAVGPLARQVAGPVHPGAGRAGDVGQEALRRQGGVAPVAPADADAAHVQFGDLSGRRRSTVRGQQQAAHVVDGPADRHGSGVLCRVEPPGGHVDRALRRAVQVPDLDVEPAQHPLAQFGPQFLSTRADHPQAVATPELRVGGQQPQHGRHDLQHGRPPVEDGLDQGRRVTSRLGSGDRHRRAAREGREDLPLRGVERQRGLLQQSVRW
jgi:hypothetical protein